MKPDMSPLKGKPKVLDLRDRLEDRLDSLQFFGDTTLVKVVTREVTIVQPQIQTKKESLLVSMMKSKEFQDDFLREIIPAKKDPQALDKLWGSGKHLFKNRKDIFEDEWVE